MDTWRTALHGPIPGISGVSTHGATPWSLDFFFSEMQIENGWWLGVALWLGKPPYSGISHESLSLDLSLSPYPMNIPWKKTYETFGHSFQYISIGISSWESECDIIDINIPSYICNGHVPLMFPKHDSHIIRFWNIWKWKEWDHLDMHTSWWESCFVGRNRISNGMSWEITMGMLSYTNDDWNKLESYGI